MSRYRFVASDSILEEVDLSGFVKLKVKDIKRMSPMPRGPIPIDELDDDMEVLYAASESDIGGLQISKCTNPPYGLERYINKRHIYWLNGKFDFKCISQLREYLRSNIFKSHTVEIWSIWFGDETQDILHNKICFDEIETCDFGMLNNTDCCITIGCQP